MLKGMTAAEASAHTAYMLGQEADERLWQVWLNGNSEGQTFDQFKAAQKSAARAPVERAVVRALRPGEEADRLAFAARFVKFNTGEGSPNG